MIEEAIDKILGLRDVEKFEIGGRQYTNQRIYEVGEPMPAALEVNTLTGLVDYVTDCIDGLDLSKSLVQVVDPITVCLHGALIGDFKARPTMVKASSCVQKGYPFDRFLELEQFIIKLQAHFVASDDMAQIMAFVTSIDSDATVNQTDDGVSQKTVIKQGVASRAEAIVPNPVTLAPFRTFLEVDQPESQYVFRIQNKSGVSAALFEAGGGQWQLEAIQRINTWLKKNLPGGLKVIA